MVTGTADITAGLLLPVSLAHTTGAVVGDEVVVLATAGTVIRRVAGTHRPTSVLHGVLIDPAALPAGLAVAPVKVFAAGYGGLLGVAAGLGLGAVLQQALLQRRLWELTMPVTTAAVPGQLTRACPR